MVITNLNKLIEKATELRRRVLFSLYNSQSGHPGSSLSISDIIATLFFGGQMDLEGGDRFILSKGHAVPSLYAALSMIGHLSLKDLATLREEGSDLQGHPVADTLPHIHASTGSLGQGISFGLGMAKAQQMNGMNGRIYVIVGDGELQEGQNWEAIMAAPRLSINDLTVVIDNNGFQNDGKTNDIMPLGDLAGKFRSFGWHVQEVDGHDLEALTHVFEETRRQNSIPSVIIAKTVKGKGVAHMEGNRKKHNGAISSSEFRIAMEGLGSSPQAYEITLNDKSSMVSKEEVEKIAVRDAFGDALVEAGKNYENIVVVDCDLGGATKTSKFGKEFPDRFVQVGIAEQNGVSIAAGMAKEGFRPFISSFAAFLTQRAKDQIMNSVGYSNAGVVLVGSHSGLAIGKDGATQMGIDDINSMAGIPKMEIYSPADGIETAAIIDYLAKGNGYAYLRTSRRPLPQVHDSSNYEFIPGKAEIIREGSNKARISIIATGDMVYHALEASKELAKDGLDTDVINIATISSIDSKTIRKYAEKRKGILTLEDHSRNGGLGSKVAELVADVGLGTPVYRHGIKGFGESGDPADLYRKHKLDIPGIIEIIKQFNLNIEK